MSLGLGLGLDKNSFISAGGFDSDYQAVLDYATTQGYTLPSSAQQDLQNQLVLDLKSGGIFSKLDTLAVFATDGNSNFALVDWIRLITMTAVNSPTFTTNEGFNGDGSTSYVNSLFNPNTDGSNYILNSASYWRYKFSQGTVASREDYTGARSGSTDVTVMASRNGANADNYINSGFSATFLNETTTTGAVQVLNRSGASSIQIYFDGVETDTSTVSSNTLTNEDEFAVGGVNVSGSLSLPGNSTIAVRGMGASLTSAEVASLNTAVKNYMSAI